MNELLNFQETKQRPTLDGGSYEPYLAKEIAIESATSIIVTCHDEKNANVSVGYLKASKSSNHILGESEYSYDTLTRINATQFRITGKISLTLDELGGIGCISTTLRDNILQDERVIRLLSSSRTDEELAELVQKYDPALWKKMADSPQVRDVQIRSLKLKLASGHDPHNADNTRSQVSPTK